MIRKFFDIITASIVLSAFADSAGAANLVSNGGFESSNIGNAFYVHVPSGANLIDDWQVVGNPGQGVDIVSNRVGHNGYVFSGEQAIDMAGTPGPGSIFQDLATTPNTTYDLSFYASSNGGAKANGLSVFWDGILIDIISTPSLGNWELFTYNVAANSNLTRLEFTGNFGGVAGSLIDEVKVESESVPEPLGIFSLAAVLSVFVLKRKQ